MTVYCLISWVRLVSQPPISQAKKGYAESDRETMELLPGFVRSHLVVLSSYLAPMIGPCQMLLVRNYYRSTRNPI